MGVLAIGRKAIEAGDSYHLREPGAPYRAHFGLEKRDIGPAPIFGMLFPNNQYVSLDRPNANASTSVRKPRQRSR